MAYQPKSYRKFVATAATATLVATAFAPFASAHSFKDVETKYNEAVDYLVSKGVTGYTDGTFKTQKTITRLEAAEMLGKALGLTEVKDAPASGFTDVPARVATLINAFKAKGITAGKTATTFGANDNITRGELAIWIQKAYDLKAKEGSSNKFGDVADRYKVAVQALVDNEITQGTTETTFGTTANAKRGDYALFIKRAVDASTTDVASVKAINATTVEVTYKENVTVSDVNASKYTIDGLTVSNAAVKQTDAKTVVLTTSVQEGGKEYAVKQDDKEIGKFKGVAAVIPSAISVVEKSIQGVLGQEVTVKAQVTVKEGDSKAGVPVTFNISGSNTQYNQPQVVEATTNADGVATYTYTRYANTTDTVVAYATGDRTKFSTGTVYWAAAKQLTVKDITEATTLVNGSKKVYEINSAKNAGKYVFVTFEENLNKTPDIVVKGVTVEGVSTNVLDPNGVVTSASALYPYEVTTGGKAVTVVKLDANGKANLVVTGSNAAVTPIVFEGTISKNAGVIATDYNAAYSAQALQAKASTVKFELKHQLGLTLQAEGVQNAATYKNSKETGGRDYTITYTDKDGKVAAADSGVKVAIDTTGVKGTLRVLDAKGNVVSVDRTVSGVNYYTVKVAGKEGKATFTVTSTNENDYVSPVAFIDNGKTTGTGVLDTDDLQTQGESTYFVDGITYSAGLVALDANDNKVTSVVANGTSVAKFVYRLTDQNGKPRSSADATTVSFQVTAGTSAITVGSTTIQPGDTKTVPAIFDDRATQVAVSVTASQASTATVTATGSKAGVVLPSTTPASVTVTFVSTTEIVPGVSYTGTVKSVNKNAKTVVLNINGKDNTLSYAGAKVAIKGTGSSENAFETALRAGDTVVYIKGTQDSFDIVGQDRTAPVLGSAVYEAAKAAVTEVKSFVEIQGIKFTSTKVGTAGDNVTIKLVDTDKNNKTATVAYDSVGNVLVIDLAGNDDSGSYAITDTLSAVIDKVNSVKTTTGIEAVLKAGENGTDLAIVSSGNDKTKGGVNAEAEITDSTLTLTFDKTIANTSDVAVAVTGKVLGTNPVYTWNATNKVLTIKLGAGATVGTGDVVSSTGAKDASGNAQTGSVTIN